jgi:hypothetical protein
MYEDITTKNIFFFNLSRDLSSCPPPAIAITEPLSVPGEEDEVEAEEGAALSFRCDEECLLVLKEGSERAARGAGAVSEIW